MDERDTLSPEAGAFVIQFRASTDATQGRFAGRIEHVASGEAAHFRTPKELTDFVKQVLTGWNQNKPSEDT